VFWRDAQAGVPSTEWPRAQLAFKDSMVHGILQFTPGIAFRYVLHRCESRDIRCRESCGLNIIATQGLTSKLVMPSSYTQCSLTPSAPWVLLPRASHSEEGKVIVVGRAMDDAHHRRIG
jgi:hypothetical protein